MPNKSGNAYGLTTLCPLKKTGEGNESPVLYTRTILQDLPTYTTKAGSSPMAKVKNTYLARFFILDDTIFQAYPYEVDPLKSKYLVFAADFHGELEPYLEAMYKSIAFDIHRIWKYGVGFQEQVSDSESFIHYIKKCQVETTFYFNGSTDDSLEEQLKSLYLKQEFSKFVFANQSKPAEYLLQAYKEFVKEVQPANLSFPTWQPGAGELEDTVKQSQAIQPKETVLTL